LLVRGARPGWRWLVNAPDADTGPGATATPRVLADTLEGTVAGQRFAAGDRLSGHRRRGRSSADAGDGGRGHRQADRSGEPHFARSQRCL